MFVDFENIGNVVDYFYHEHLKIFIKYIKKLFLCSF